MDRRRKTGFLVVLVVVSGCAAGTAPPAAGYRFVGPYEKKAEGRFFQHDRPTRCEAARQPAVVDLVGQAHTPVWSCLPACPPGEEYVTSVMLGFGEGDRGPKLLSASCQRVCPSGQHRLSYVDFADKAHCAPGEPPDEERQALTTEQQRMTEAHERARDEAYRPIEAMVSELEKKPVPWDDGTLDLSNRAALAILQLPIAQRDLARTAALENRFSTLSGPRSAASDARKSRRRAARTAETCRRDCSRSRDACSRACADVSAAACEACRVESETCFARCPAP